MPFCHCSLQLGEYPTYTKPDWTHSVHIGLVWVTYLPSLVYSFQVSLKGNYEDLHLKLDKQFSLALDHGPVNIRCTHFNRHGGQPSVRTKRPHDYDSLRRKRPHDYDSLVKEIPDAEPAPKKAQSRQEQQIYLELPHYTREQTSSRFWENIQKAPRVPTTCSTDQNHTSGLTENSRSPWNRSVTDPILSCLPFSLWTGSQRGQNKIRQEKWVGRGGACRHCFQCTVPPLVISLLHICQGGN